MKREIIGYVVGVTYLDGDEWLYHGLGLCSLNPFRKESRPTLYDSEAKAQGVANYLNAMRNPKVFGDAWVRAYWRETF